MKGRFYQTNTVIAKNFKDFYILVNKNYGFINESLIKNKNKDCKYPLL